MPIPAGRITVIKDQQPSGELDKYLAWLISENKIDIDPHGYIGQ